MIHEVALSQYPISTHHSDVRKLDLLWKCLQAAKNWFELFLQFSPAMYMGFPMTVYSSLALCVAALWRLSTLEHPGWDLVTVRETCNLSSLLAQACSNLSLIKITMGLDPETEEDISMFAAANRRTSAIKQWCDARFACQSARPAAEATAEQSGNLSDTLLDFADDAWLRDILNAEDRFGWENMSM